MKRNTLLTLACSTSVLALTAVAQNNNVNPTPSPAAPAASSPYSRVQPVDSSTSTASTRFNPDARASDLLGMPVKNAQNEKLGKVEEVAVDLESGQIVQVILSVGGFLGMGDTLVSVPPSALHHDVQHRVLHLNANKDQLRTAPRFDNSKWNDQFTETQLNSVDRHYSNIPHSKTPPLEKIRNESKSQTGNDADSKSRRQYGTWDQANKGGYSTFSKVPADRLGKLQKASKLIGMPVENHQAQSLGKIENLILDLSASRVAAVIISSGGFLGMGDELSAVPPSALQLAQDVNLAKLNTTKEALSNAPHFKSHQWPDFSQPAYSEGVYRAYQVQPYFNTNGAVNADNTVRNVRDRDSNNPTPLDQGSSDGDIQATTRIRKEILATPDMSVNAQNVKIITSQGHVTLRGPVNSQSEKDTIGKIAARIANPENVSNQLEVKLETGSSN